MRFNAQKANYYQNQKLFIVRPTVSAVGLLYFTFQNMR